MTFRDYLLKPIEDDAEFSFTIAGIPSPGALVRLVPGLVAMPGLLEEEPSSHSVRALVGRLCICLWDASRTASAAAAPPASPPVRKGPPKRVPPRAPDVAVPSKETSTRAPWAREPRVMTGARIRREIADRLAKEPNRSQAIEAALEAWFSKDPS